MLEMHKVFLKISLIFIFCYKILDFISNYFNFIDFYEYFIKLFINYVIMQYLFLHL
jgi:hypothetical protein